MSVRYLTLLFVFFPAVGSWANPPQFLTEGFVARCSEPTGPSLSYGWLHRIDGEVLQSPNDGFLQDTDGFSNMNPLFIYKPDQPRTILSIWGDTRPNAGSPEILDEYAETSIDRNAVIARTEHLISAVLRVGEEIWLTTLIPSLEIGYFSYHEINRSFLAEPAKKTDISARSSALSAECEFSRIRE